MGVELNALLKKRLKVKMTGSGLAGAACVLRQLYVRSFVLGFMAAVVMVACSDNESTAKVAAEALAVSDQSAPTQAQQSADHQLVSLLAACLAERKQVRSGETDGAMRPCDQAQRVVVAASRLSAEEEGAVVKHASRLLELYQSQIRDEDAKMAISLLRHIRKLHVDNVGVAFLLQKALTMQCSIQWDASACGDALEMVMPSEQQIPEKYRKSYIATKLYYAGLAKYEIGRRKVGGDARSYLRGAVKDLREAEALLDEAQKESPKLADVDSERRVYILHALGRAMTGIGRLSYLEDARAESVQAFAEAKEVFERALSSSGRGNAKENLVLASGVQVANQTNEGWLLWTGRKDRAPYMTKRSLAEVIERLKETLGRLDEKKHFMQWLAAKQSLAETYLKYFQLHTAREPYSSDYLALRSDLRRVQGVADAQVGGDARTVLDLFTLELIQYRLMAMSASEKERCTGADKLKRLEADQEVRAALPFFATSIRYWQKFSVASRICSVSELVLSD